MLLKKVYISEYKFIRERKDIFLMILREEIIYYLQVTTLSAVLRGRTLKNNVHF